MGDGDAGSEVGVALDTYSHVLHDMQEKAVEAMNGVLGPRSKE